VAAMPASVLAPVQTSVQELGSSRVRLQVRVPAEQVEARLQDAARRLGRELKLPGFRKGKVPAPMVLQRLGRETVLDEAVRDGLTGWYVEGIRAAGLATVGDPKLELGDLPAPGQELSFSVEIGVLPEAELGPYRGLEVPRREPAVDDEQIEREIEAMRERLARLQTAERSAEQGDFVVIDYVGRLPQVVESTDQEEGGAPQTTLVPFEGGEGRDQLVELGAGNLIPGFEEGLLGAGAGETRTVELAFPPDYPNAELAGREASFEITVKEVKRKELPEVDEDFAIDAGFDDVTELREEIRGRLAEAEEGRVEQEFREAALDAAVAEAKVPLTPELAQARAKEMWERMLHTLAHRGISREAYLQISGREESEALAELIPDAEQALRREAVLTAVVVAESISPSEEELAQALTPSAEREEVSPEELLTQLRDAGRLEEAREDLAARQAIDLIAREATPIAPERAQAREKLWTPEKEQEQEREREERERAQAGHGEGSDAGGLWTPGS
jgi:trigger factor